MDSLALLVGLWVVSIFLPVGGIVYARLFTHDPAWYRRTLTVAIAVAVAGFLLLLQTSSFWLVLAPSALLMIVFAVSTALLLRERRDSRAHRLER